MDFVPPRLLRHHHLQSTLASSPWRRRRVVVQAGDFLAVSRAEVADAGDGVRLLVAHTPPRGGRKAPVAALFHGWEGGADSTYMIAAGNRLWQAGFRVIRVNMRDHGGSHHLNRGLFHSCRLDEMVGAVRWIRGRFPAESLHLTGFSLGGNFVLRIAARVAGLPLRVDSAVAVCPVLDPEETMMALDGGWTVYRRYFLGKWRRSLELKARTFPDLYDFSHLPPFRTLEAMTAYFVTRYAGFPDLCSYLRGYALTGERLAGIEVPTRMLMAEDDPLIPVGGLQRMRVSAAVRVERSRFGGHCGFLADWRLGSRLEEWILDACRVNPDSRTPDS